MKGYMCQHCNHQFIAESALPSCPACGKKVVYRTKLEYTNEDLSETLEVGAFKHKGEWFVNVENYYISSEDEQGKSTCSTIAVPLQVFKDLIKNCEALDEISDS